MIINLIDSMGGFNTPVRWNTDEPLPAPQGDTYMFVGTDTLEGGLSLTLRFSDVHDVDEFMVTAQSAYADPNLSQAQVERWGRFMESLAVLVDAAPKFGETRIYTHPRPIPWNADRSYHASIDARRGIETGNEYDEWPAEEEGTPPS